MSESCYVGRGIALAKVRGSNSGYLPLAGEGDISITYGGTILNITDSRLGSAQIVDTVTADESVSVQFTSGRLNMKTVRLLFGSSQEVLKAAETGLTTEFPAAVLGNTYFLGRCGVSSVVIEDALSNVIPADNYQLDTTFGFVVFKDVTGFTLPFTATFNSAEYNQQGHLFNNFVDLDLIISLTNKINNQKILVEPYKPRLQVSGVHRIVSREFSNLQASLLLFADYTKPDTGVFGVYGKTSYIQE